ncbi:hypothetical protein NODU109028_16550 [Nocardioides dubius]|uniref:Uncharacterized protein n=1 Tax=Nocardioides dubius TaxID=317019 RepID=A0ABP4EI99_9ACTN
MAEGANPNPYRLFIILGLADIVVGLVIVAFGWSEDLGPLLVAGAVLTVLGLLMAGWASLQKRRTPPAV